MSAAARLACEHLLLRLRPLNRALRRAVARQQRLAARLARPEAVPLCVTDDHAAALLDDADALLRGEVPGAGPAEPTPEELRQEEELRRRAQAEGLLLPLDALARAPGLSPFEQEALLLAAAPELARSYERLYGYVLDDLNRRFPSAELLASLTAGSAAERLGRLALLGPFGLLRRTRLLVAPEPAPTAARQELRLGPGVLELLGSGRGDPGLFHDPDEVALPAAGPPPAELDAARLGRLARALADGTAEAIGLWAGQRGIAGEAALHLLRQAGLPARRLSLCRLPARVAEAAGEIERALAAAAALGTALWIPAGRLAEAEYEERAGELAEALAASRVPVVLSGRHPWRPTRLLAERSYAEWEIPPAGYATRRALWEEHVTGLDTARRDDLAARFRLGGGELAAAARMARTAARVAGNGRPEPLGRHLEEACAAVARRRSYAFATLVRPRRGPADLVLPADLHRQVLEVARFYRAWPRVAEGWGFGRLVTGGGGIKVLFTGDSGTGKTLAAEVIAGELGVLLVKVDLARVVSKWVGETEKNLAAAFDEAEESHAVLFFDEADALFGKRAEVERGTDRYANLEVSYLLQRLEESQALVLLASNLREAIDPAFTRRFQVTLHFPRPGEAERRRIWERALPEPAPRDDGLDLDSLARLDLTGGGITSAARTAALLATDGDGGGPITMRHLAEAVARQFKREARLLDPRALTGLVSPARESPWSR